MTDSFIQHFQAIEDPRIDRCKRHELLDIILLAVSAVLSGAEGWEQIEHFGIHRLDWLRRYRPFEYGIPRHDTIARVICRLKPEEIEKAFQSWMRCLIEFTGNDVIAIDGKTARRSLIHVRGEIRFTRSALGVVNISSFSGKSRLMRRATRYLLSQDYSPYLILKTVSSRWTQWDVKKTSLNR